MAQLRDIKARIDSVTKPRKMTQAMKMVAAAKFKRASDMAMNSRPYLSYLEKMLALIEDQTEVEANVPILNVNDHPEKIIVVITSDRGLCGGFNSLLIRKVENYLLAQNDPVSLVTIGNKGYKYFKSKKWPILSHHEGLQTDVSIKSIETILRPLIAKYVAKEVGQVILFYNEFVTAVTSKLIEKKLLPISVDHVETPDVIEDYLLEPSPEAIVYQLARDCVNYTVFRAFLESNAAEQGSRMVAMDSATDNAGEMIQSLKLIYNRGRQAQITTELSEIVAGSEALSA